MIGTEDLDCGMALMAKGCDQHPESGINKEACCENELVSLHTDNEFNSELEAHVPSDQGHCSILTNSIAVYIAPVPYSAEYSKYAPPLLDSDLNTLLQVFRI